MIKIIKSYDVPSSVEEKGLHKLPLGAMKLSPSPFEQSISSLDRRHSSSQKSWKYVYMTKK